MRPFRGRFGAVLVVVLLGCAAVIAAWLDPAPPPIAGNARASDGDSFRLGDQRVRLLGIDAPEYAQTCDDARGRPWSCGRSARDRMAQLLGAGKVDCRPEDHDQYGRLLAVCTVGGRDIAQVMVAEGLAISSGRYWSDEQAARRDSKGIWAGGFETPRSWRDDHPRPSSFLGWLGSLLPW